MAQRLKAMGATRFQDGFAGNSHSGHFLAKWLISPLSRAMLGFHT
jgi:hypothetical protein